ncbi:DUF3087 family protein [Vibrio sp. D404a]|uniref:DUF3087 family protein n=1 Tax=unclassified Vibrio TaxID=2614977 RepID=UPI0025553E51|nr:MULTISPECIES: DUF3087 family protein [unclassified Vibrio]MDK9738922.1 DUF3087 family protein [Vibrio sp. D404a]MDK9798303.1 DUF3087 family protein [Vibrio sp. D449a]
MRLQKIDKEQYRRKMNVLLIGLVASLAISAIGFGSLLIELFGSTDNLAGESTGNFHLNLLGVVLAIALNAFIASKIKTHPYLNEAVYVWNLKQIHNQIYRKLKKIKAASESGNRNALTTLFFYYTTQKQVYDLDNNTLTISSVQNALENIENEARNWGIELSLNDFTKEMIAEF